MEEEKKLKFELPRLSSFDRPKFTLDRIKKVKQIAHEAEQERKVTKSPYISTDGYEDDEEDAKEDPEQHWYALQIDPKKIKYIYEGISRVMNYHCIELISIFDPHYKKEVKKKRSDIGFRKAFSGDQLYDGYFFICMKEYDMEEMKSDIRQIPGVLSVLGIFSEKEFDAMYQTFLKMSGIKSFMPTKKNTSIELGMKVMVKEGQYGSLGGIVTGFQKNKTLAIVQMDLFGRETNVSVPLEFIVQEAK